MKRIDPPLLLALCLTATTGVRADDAQMQTNTSNSEFNYYGADQPFAHPAPPSLSTIPPGSYIPVAPRTFIPIATDHGFSDSRLPTVADATVRVFIRSYDSVRGVYVNQEVFSPTCLLACLSRQEPAL
ncbi:hypothetical protein SAMN04487857_112137 [Pseudomonas sp. ok272]|uniref:hypothetical protein n=1 Tax=unclassified Pseudomonas TaxID=196821 RepID=UPI0008C8ACE4|nr:MULTISPECIES: hypothetical protein [unclassified Pseudomonas]SEN25717.1 hypothetical protein SAMN04487857_112137 [Pseudomonas sp. ok272]SFN16656.1 hypothetical protein SAMN04487858_113137 [Pseudomonas sp. ok602]